MRLNVFSETDSARNALSDMMERVFIQHSSLFQSKQLGIELDLDEGQFQRARNGHWNIPELELAFRELISVAANSAPHGDTIHISAYPASDSLEIEVAIGAGDITLETMLAPVSPAFSRRSSRMSAGSKADTHPSNVQLLATRCPDGGVAWTLLCPTSSAMRKVA